MTKEQLDLALFLIYQVFVPAISLMGIIGNVLGAVILFQSGDKNAFSTYLKALTISDIFILCCGMLRFLCALLETYMRDIATLIGAYCQIIISFGVGNALWTFSSGLIVIMSVERFIAVAFPLQIRNFFLENNPRRVIVGLLLVQIILRTPSLIWTEIKSFASCKTNGTIYYLDYREWSRDLLFRRIFFYILVAWDMIIPVSTVILMNIAILITLKRRVKLPASTRKKETRQNMERKITLTLLVLSTFYVITVLPHMTLYVVVTLGPKFSLTLKEYYLYSTIINTNILIVCLNAANDFVIYILASSHFRSLFKKKYFGWRMEPETQEITEEEDTRNPSASVRSGTPLPV